jgi:hypothetical protein
MPKLIISYRRSDSDGIAGRIRDNLAAYYGNDSIFIDVDNIPFGTDFREHIRKAFSEHDLMLAIVGQKWLGARKGGRTRIQDETDPVRIEIEMALQRKMPVIPVLVDGARMPKPEELPELIKKFSFLNAAQVDSGRDFRQHMDRLMRSIDQILHLKPREQSKSASGARIPKVWFAAAAALIAVVVAGFLAIYPWPTGIPGPGVTKPQGEVTVDFSNLPVGKDPVVARPYLNKYGISVSNLVPAKSELVFINNRGMYEGGAIMPTTSQIVLTQINTNNVPASFTLMFAKPVARVSFTRPALYAATSSGVSHPAWKATALAADGQELASQSEGLLRKMKNPKDDIVDAQTYTLVSVTFAGISALRFESDPRGPDGKPFAGFSALLIEQLAFTESK